MRTPPHGRRTDDPNYGPTRDEIQDALDAVLSQPMPNVPNVGTVRVLREAFDFPITVEDRRILDAQITRGDPQHGAKRSDDHVSKFQIEYRKDCPECPSERAVYTYNTHHHIAGSESVVCRRCEHEHHSEQWG